MLYRKSLLCLEGEKLSILSKELKYLFLICDYYDTYNTKKSPVSSEKKDLEYNFHLLKKQIEILRDSLASNFNNLKTQIEWLDKHDDKNILEIQSLIYLDMLREYIKTIVKKISLLSTKISQSLKDGYNQYIPKPILGKRHSNINITSQVELSVKKRLEELLKNNDKRDLRVNALVVWDYNDEYKIVEYLDDSKGIVFNLSYWYFEFSYFLPSLTHEIGHLVDKNQLFSPIILENKLRKSISRRESYALENIPKTLASETMADVTAFLYHGISYIYALTHKLLGKELSKTFQAKDKENHYNKHYYIINIDGLNIENSFLIAPYRFRIKRDLIYIRIYALLKVRDIILDIAKNKKDSYTKGLPNKFGETIIEIKNIEHIERLLNSMYHINKDIHFNSDIPSNLDLIYKNYHNFNKDYCKTKNIVEKLFTTTSEYFQENKEIIVNILKLSNNNEEKHKYSEIPKHFNDIWSKRFSVLKNNQTIHRYEYRKKIHDKTLIKLIENNLLSEDNIQPYTMVFRKFRIDKLEEYEDIPLVKFGNENIEQGRVLGIYDYFYLRKLDSKFEIKKLIHFEPENVKFYESSFSLIKIMNDIKGTGLKDNNINAIIQIEVLKTFEESEDRDIYDNLFEDLKKIYAIFNKQKDPTKFHKIEFFKSLGPKDIAIHIDSSSIDFIFMIKKLLYKEFNRTFTTFYLDRKAKENIISEHGYFFSSSLRMHSNYIDKNFKKICTKYKNNIEKIHLKTGVMDFVILWNKEISLEIIYDFYKELIAEKMVVDIQTAIDENVIF